MVEERKLVTVVFADVIGSTALGDHLDPERLHHVLDSYYRAMAEVVGVWGGTVEQFAGDAVVAVFGVPVTREDDAERALSASLQMLSRLDELNSQLKLAHGFSLQVRIGVNTGEVLAATGSGPEPMVVTGDAVNVASRLQAAAEPGTVLVGDRTFLAAQRSFSFAEPIALTIRGKAEPVRSHRVIAALSQPRSDLVGLRAPIVGREIELQLLLNAFDDVMTSGNPHLVTVVGQAGVGKSRLVREFASAAAERNPSARQLRGRCLAAGQGITYWPLAEILRTACGISLNDPVDVSGKKLRDVVGGVLRGAGSSEPEIERTIFAVAMTAGIELPGNPLTGLSPESVAEELAHAWPRFVSALARNGLVLIVEDLHWAGDAMITMLERIVARSEGPLLVAATARPDAVENRAFFAAGSDDFSTITLRALSERHTQELVDALLQVAELPDDVRAAIHLRTQGNPLFVEEILQRLIEAGGLVRKGDSWVATQSASQVPIPETLHALLAARIDGLGASEKRVLQEAAILGKVFWEEPLSQMTGLPDVHSALLELERRGLVYASIATSLAGQREFSFKHVLLRDVAYAGVPKARRARAHAWTADWIAELAGDRREELAELIAYHYEAAASGEGAELAWEDLSERESVRQKAFAQLMLAGDSARRRFAVSKAVELHERALALARGEAERERALEAIGDDHDSAYHGEAATLAFEQALDALPTAAAFAQDRSRLYWKIAWLKAYSPGAFKRSPDGADVDDLISDAASQAPDDLSRARLLVAKGAAARLWRGAEPFGQGEGTDPIPIDQRISFAEEGRATGMRLDDRGLVRLANKALRILYLAAGRYADTLNLARSEMEQPRGTRSRIEEADAVREVAWLELTVAGNFELSLALALRSHELSKGSNPHQIMHATWPVMVALFDLGRWQEIGPFLEEHLAAFRKDPAVVCQFVRDGPLIGATLLTYTGNAVKARELAAMVADPRDDLARASAWQARYAIASGEPQIGWDISRTKAMEPRSYGPDHAQQAVEALVALQSWGELAVVLPKVRRQVPGNGLLEPVIDRGQGVMAAATGDASEGASVLRKALARFESLGAAFEVARTNERLAHLLGDPEGRVHAEAALSGYERVGAIPLAERVRAGLVAPGDRA